MPSKRTGGGDPEPRARRGEERTGARVGGWPTGNQGVSAHLRTAGQLPPATLFPPCVPAAFFSSSSMFSLAYGDDGEAKS